MKESDITTDYRTASGIIHPNRCHLAGIVVTPDGSNDTYVDVYDGTDSNADKILRIRAVSTTSNPFVFEDHITMQYGIYIAFETNCESATILYHGL